jgi:uncharacterized protein
MQAGSEASGTPAPQWQAISSRQRRVAGVLVEKAKTVPDSYPMTLNAIVTGCNQKNNRDPQMELSEEDVQQALDDLRALGAVTEVQNSGRVPKYRHHLYEWLGVDKVEIAVMAELLLRGPQTIGELRGRAARMEPIADVNALQAILKSLAEKRLVIELTPAGRGQIVAHNLFKERELVEIRAEYAKLATQAASTLDDEPRPAPTHSVRSTAGPAPGFTPGVTSDMFTELKLEVAELRAEVARLRSELQELNMRLS